MSNRNLATIADAVQVALLYDLAKDQGDRYAKLAELYETRFIAHQDFPFWADEDPDIWRGQDRA